MKKVGIITYFHFYNYGTMLQALALCKLCNDRGTHAEIIDYKFAEMIKKSKWNIVKIRICRLLVYIKEFRRVVTTFKYRHKMVERQPYFDRFLNDNFQLSSKSYQYENELYRDIPQYDIYITGSDQTWSPKIGFRGSLFLQFAPPKTIKAAYAPSIGVTSFTKEQILFLQENLSRYKFLSCRESVGADLLSSITNRNVEVVLDPTLMVSGDDWRALSVKPEMQKPYILCYFLGHRKYYRKYVKQLQQKTGYDVYYIPVSWIDCKKSNKLLFDVGPSEFLGLIDQAEIVCTDSFHGMCFSINLNKNFYGFVKHKGQIDSGDNSRIYDLLDRMDLKSRLLTENILNQDWNICPINYENVNSNLAYERKRSDNFLIKILQSND